MGKYFVLIHLMAGHLPVLDCVSAIAVYARLHWKKLKTAKL